MAEKDLIDHELTKNIIGSAIEVHRNLGCGFLESVYEEAFAVEMNLRSIPYQRQKTINVRYKQYPVKQFVCDFLVYDKVIVELKAITALSGIEVAQVLNYLKACNLKLGLLLNFGSGSLEVKRIINPHFVEVLS
jgi:GxxExxY protein